MRFALILLAALAASEARAASADMATLTCQDWLDADEDPQNQMIAWLRGYIAARSTSTLYDAGNARGDSALMKAYCQAHPAVGLLSAVSQWKR